LAIGQAGATYVGQKQAYSSNVTASNLTAANEYNILEQKRVQVDQERSESALDTAIAAAQSQGRITASASEQGLSNTSLIQALNADMFGIGRQASIESANDQNQRNQLSNESQGVELDRRARIASVSKPSGLSLVLGIGQGALGGISAYQGAGGRIAGSKIKARS
jgi:cell division protein FtsL